MGPQLYRCGNLFSRPETCGSVLVLQWGRNFIVAETGISFHDNRLWFMLQWGRNFIVAETTNSRAYGQTSSVLQWGRNFIVAETSLLSCSISARYACFNGAATLSLRKRRYSTNGCSVFYTLQWGRNFIVAETKDARHRISSYHQLQWGRNFIVAETGRFCLP